MMLEDVQEIVCKWIFSGDLPCEVCDFEFPDMAQESWVHNINCSREMMKAALVCKSWNQAHK
jgi:hypothetical protein